MFFVLVSQDLRRLRVAEGQKHAVVARESKIPGMMEWPLDEDGRPLAYVAMQVSELIGLPNYSNVTIGPAMAAGFCRDTKDDRRAKLAELTADVENVVAVERAAILALVKGN